MFSGLDHWPVSKGLVYQLEATSYALLALVRAGVRKDQTCGVFTNAD